MIKLHAYVGEGAPVPPTQHIWARLPEVSFGGFTQTPSRRPSFLPSLFFTPSSLCSPVLVIENVFIAGLEAGRWRERVRERDTLQLMKIWLWLGPQGLAPLLLHQLTASVNFFCLFCFSTALFVYASFVLLTPLCLASFYFSVWPFVFFALLPLSSFVCVHHTWLDVHKIHFKCKWCCWDRFKICVSISDFLEGKVSSIFQLCPSLNTRLHPQWDAIFPCFNKNLFSYNCIIVIVSMMQRLVSVLFMDKYGCL